MKIDKKINLENLCNFEDEDDKPFFVFCLPTYSLFKFNIVLEDPFLGQFPFFCLLNKDFEPVYHMSFECESGKFSFLVGKFLDKKNKWVHFYSDFVFNVGEKYSFKIDSLDCKKIIINDKEIVMDSDDLFLGSFRHSLNCYLSFGSLDNIPSKKIVSINDFKIMKGGFFFFFYMYIFYVF